MPSYPLTPLWSYPLVRSLEFATQIAAGLDGTEQRTMLTTGRESWTLNYPRLNLASRDLIIAPFETAKGSYAADITFVLGAETFTNCYFDAQALRCVENSARKWNLTVVLRQSVRTADAGSLPTDFPTLTSGAKIQYPATHERQFDNVVGMTEGGRFSAYNRATSLRLWSAGGPVLIAADALAIFNIFRLARGRFREFAFTCPDTLTRYEHCRFASDTLTWNYSDYGQNAVQVEIQQVVS